MLVAKFVDNTGTKVMRALQIKLIEGITLDPEM
jgi:hypothetical protein